jgi:hypothetical protein
MSERWRSRLSVDASGAGHANPGAVRLWPRRGSETPQTLGEHWASVGELWEAALTESQERNAGRVADNRTKGELRVQLDRSLAELIAGFDHND